jgi:hypothetical protein
MCDSFTDVTATRAARAHAREVICKVDRRTLAAETPANRASITDR